MLMSPNGYYCEQLAPSGFPTSHHQSNGMGNQLTSGPASMFPSMSVNVSMNMTYHPTAMTGYDQVQWGASPQATSPGAFSKQYFNSNTGSQSFSHCSLARRRVSVHTASASHRPRLWNKQHCHFRFIQIRSLLFFSPTPGYIQNQSGLLSPGYAGGATYSFTADFRPPNVQDVPLITTNSSFKPMLNSKTQFSPVRHGKKMGFVSPGKLQMVCSDDESQRPNLCRICGKCT